MKTPRSIYFQEENLASSKVDCDETVPFWRGAGHPLFCQAATPEVYEDSYERIFNALIPWIEKESPEWFYRDVNLLWCFKYLFFIHGHYSFLLYQAFKKSISGKNTADIRVLLNRYPETLGDPRLSEILKFTDWKERLEFVGGDADPVLQNPKPSPVALKDILWPKKLLRGDIKKCKVALYADIFRFENLISEIGFSKTCVYSTVKSPKVYLRALQTGCAYYQDTETPAKAPDLDLWFKKIDSLTFGRELKYEGLDLGGFYQSRLRRLLKTHLKGMLAQIDKTHEFFREAGSLSSALLDEDISIFKNIFCQVASKYGVKTSVKAHGALGGKIGFLPLTADNILVWGEKGKKKLIRWGVDPKKVRVTGCSWHEKYRKSDRLKARKQILKKYGFSERKPLVLVALHARRVLAFVHEDAIQHTIDWTLKAVSDMGDYQFIIKLHHGEARVDYYTEWLRRSGLSSRVAISRLDNPYVLAMAADVVVSHHSTYAIDALALSKPAICLYDDFIQSCIGEFEADSVFYRAKNGRELEEHLKSALDPGDKNAEKKNQVLAEGLNIYENAPPPTKVITQILLEAR